MNIFAPYLRSLLDYAAYHTLDNVALKRLLKNQPIALSEPEGMISAEAYLTVFRKVIEATHDAYFGLHFGSYLNLASLGLVLEISLATSSIKQGVIILQNFLDSKFPLVSVSIVEHSNDYVLQLESLVADVKLKRHLLDLVLSIIYRELKLMLPRTIIPELSIPFTDEAPYRAALPATIRHHAHYQIALPAEIITTEINQKKIKEIELLLPKFIAMLNEGKAENRNFSQLIRDMTLNMCSPELPNFEQVQKQFPYSKRTMQRKLTAEGTSFRAIVNQIKKELSTYLNNENHLKTKDIAYILGYSESSAYLHAVKSWETKR